jgi:large subunit GTPase 1
VLDSSAYQVRTEPTQKQLEAQLKHANELKIPRRPPWDSSTTPEQLDQSEKASFLEWRRTLAELEKNEELVLTPFEKNLEVWRQLWRVVERSDLVVQIVDARNPLLMCSDLHTYVTEVDPQKKSLLLVNKADLLTKRQRVAWGKYFKKEGIPFIFWSANFERLKQEGALPQAHQPDHDDETNSNENEDNEE